VSHFCVVGGIFNSAHEYILKTRGLNQVFVLLFDALCPQYVLKCIIYWIRWRKIKLEQDASAKVLFMKINRNFAHLVCIN